MPADKLLMGGSLTAYNVKITDDARIVSRTSEVLQYINSLERVCGEMAQLPFLTYTFEEVGCWLHGSDHFFFV